MLNATTTYRDAYNSPSVKYCPIPQISFKTESEFPRAPPDCICDGQKEDKHQEYDSYEWSRLGPMGALLEPKLYGVKTDVNICSNQKIKCGDNKSWMRNLRESSNLKKVASPYHDMLRIIQEDRLRSTYNVDYDHYVEYPNICYDEEFPREPEVKEEIKCRDTIVNPPYIGGHDLPGRKPRSQGLPPVPELPVKVASERPRVPPSSKVRNPKVPKPKAPGVSNAKGPGKGIEPKGPGRGTEPKGPGRGTEPKGPGKGTGPGRINNKGKEPGRIKQNVRHHEEKRGGTPTNAQITDPSQEKSGKSIPKNYQGNLNNQPPVKKPWATTYCEVYCRPVDQVVKDECFCTAEKKKEDKK